MSTTIPNLNTWQTYSYIKKPDEIFNLLKYLLFQSLKRLVLYNDFSTGVHSLKHCELSFLSNNFTDGIKKKPQTFFFIVQTKVDTVICWEKDSKAETNI